MSPTSSDGALEQLGSIICPSGIVVLLDGGLAWMWSHDRAPLLPDGHPIASSANSSVDYAIRGPDALAAGLAFDRQSHPLYLYDMPHHGLDRFTAPFEALLRERNLDASIELLPTRISHRQRVDLALDYGSGTGEVQFHGMLAVAAAGLPRDRPLPLMGERMPAGPDEGRWRRISIECGDGETASTRRIGQVLVDEARLLAADAEALGQWNDRTSLDGLADLVIWGRDGAIVAAEIGAPPIQFAGEGAMFGWADLPIDEAWDKSKLIEACRSAERKFAFDFRPHTHHWQMMRAVRATRTESATLDLGGAQLAMFMTSWGDGAFPIEADLDPTGRLLRLRIELGCAQIVQRQRDMEELWFGAFAKKAIVSARVARDGQPVGFLYREAPDREEDSGWRIMAGDESDEYIDDPANAVGLPLREVLQRDRSLKPLLRMPAPCALARDNADGSFRVLEDFRPREG